MIRKAKNFKFKDIDCVRVGTVELPEKELLEYLQNGKRWILVRTHCYMVVAKTSPNDGSKPEFLYKKVKTKDERNTLPSRFFVMNDNEITNYLPGSARKEDEK